MTVESDTESKKLKKEEIIQNYTNLNNKNPINKKELYNKVLRDPPNNPIY